jgi:hypothetical protein
VLDCFVKTARNDGLLVSAEDGLLLTAVAKASWLHLKQPQTAL